MNTHTNLWLVTNQASGSHDDDIAGRLTEALSQAGFPPERIVDCHAQDLPTAETAEAAGLTHIAIHGGDGTLNAAITALEGWGGVVLPLPGGTANLLCNQMFEECDSIEIIRSLGQNALKPCRISCIRGQRMIALSELVAGPGAIWADVREDIRDRDVPGAIERTVTAATESAAGPMVRVSSPPRGREEGYPGIRLSPGDTGIRIQGYGGEGVADFFRQGLAILGHDFRDGPHDELGEEEVVGLASLEDSPIEMMVDGERRTGQAKESFSLAELDVDLLGPLHER